MFKAAKVDEDRLASAAQIADSDVLHFLSRTLQAHVLDGEPQSALEKLQNLLSALEQQERTLADWPDSASKTRICTALTSARKAVARIVADLAGNRSETGVRVLKAM